MKIIFTLVMVCSLGLVSCKKDYTCVCAATSNSASANESTSFKDTEKGAKEFCENKQKEYENDGFTAVCELQ